MRGPPTRTQPGDRRIGNGDVNRNGPRGLGSFREGEQDRPDPVGEVVFAAQEWGDGADVGPPEVEELAGPEPA